MRKKKKNKNEEEVKEKRRDEVEKRLDKDELNRILLKIKKLIRNKNFNANDGEELDLYYRDAYDVLKGNLDDIIELLDNVEDEEDFYCLAYHFEDISEKFKSQKFIDCIERNSKRFPNIKSYTDFEIMYAKTYMPDYKKTEFKLKEESIEILKRDILPAMKITSPINKGNLQEIRSYCYKLLGHNVIVINFLNDNYKKQIDYLIEEISLLTSYLILNNYITFDYDELNRLLGLS